MCQLQLCLACAANVSLRKLMDPDCTLQTHVHALVAQTMSYLRTTFMSRFTPFDSSIEFHKLVAWTMLTCKMCGHVRYNIDTDTCLCSFVGAHYCTSGWLHGLRHFVLRSIVPNCRGMDRHHNVASYDHHVPGYANTSGNVNAFS
jgi:hypothetical protein